MSTHFEYVECMVEENNFGGTSIFRPASIGCGTHDPDNKTRTLDKVTCGRCKRSRPYKVCRAFLLDLIDKKMLNKLGFCAQRSYDTIRYRSLGD